MRLWIAVHLSRLSLDVLRPRWSAEALPAAFAVLDDERVVALTPEASAAGVRRGMRRNGALAIAPGVVLAERDPVREREAFDAAAQALLQYTPEVAQAEENVVLLNVGASLLAFGGPRALYRRVRRTLRALGFAASVAMAPTAGGAWLLARQGGRARRRRVLTLRTLVRRLDALPCLLLPAARLHQDWLEDIACRTLGGLGRLPRAGLGRRTSPVLVQALDRAYGRQAEAFAWIEAPAVFDRYLEMPERVERAESALIAAERLIEQMCGWLAARHLAAVAVVFALVHERGRHAMPPTRLEIRLAEPVWQPAHLARLLRERVGRLALPGPIAGVRLTVTEFVPLAPPSGALFAEPGGTPADHRRLLELLAARLGREQVLHAAPLADHRPEVANRWVPAPAERTSAPGVPAADWPFWLLAEPVELETRGEQPVYGSPLRLVRGPERIEAGWWSGALAARDYFVAEDGHTARYWVYCERGAAEPRWFLHGLFA